MIIFGKCTEDGFFQVSEETKQFAIGMFGFFPHNIRENLSDFYQKELNLTFVDEEDFKLDENQILNVYELSDRRTFDHGYVIAKTFNTKNEAEVYIENAIKNSENVIKKFFTEIVVVDADLVDKHIESIVAYSKKDLENKILLKSEIIKFKKELLKKYDKNKDMLNLINSSNFENI